MYAKRTPPGEPPCVTCKEILIEENEEVAKVFMATRGQVITAGKGQIIDISIPAIKIMMDLYGVKNQKECMESVMNIFHHFLKENRDK